MKRYDKMTAQEIAYDAKVQAWEAASFFGKQLAILGKTPYIVLETMNGVAYAFRTQTLEGKETQVFPFRTPTARKGQGG